MQPLSNPRPAFGSNLARATHCHTTVKRPTVEVARSKCHQLLGLVLYKSIPNHSQSGCLARPYHNFSPCSPASNGVDEPQAIDARRQIGQAELPSLIGNREIAMR